MKKLAALILASLFAVAAHAQANSEPPTQPPAGSPGKLERLKGTGKPKVEKKARAKVSRAEQRATKVGDKPLN